MNDQHRAVLTEELRDYISQWYRVFPDGDASALAALYTEDARLYLSASPGMRGATPIAAFLAQMPLHFDLETRHSVDDIDLLTPELAVVTGAAWVKTTAKKTGERSEDAARFVMVLRRDPRGWRCCYDVSQHTPDIS